LSELEMLLVSEVWWWREEGDCLWIGVFVCGTRSWRTDQHSADSLLSNCHRCPNNLGPGLLA